MGIHQPELKCRVRLLSQMHPNSIRRRVSYPFKNLSHFRGNTQTYRRKSSSLEVQVNHHLPSEGVFADYLRLKQNHLEFFMALTTGDKVPSCTLSLSWANQVPHRSLLMIFSEVSACYCSHYRGLSHRAARWLTCQVMSPMPTRLKRRALIQSPASRLTMRL